MDWLAYLQQIRLFLRDSRRATEMVTLTIGQMGPSQAAFL